MLNSMALVCDHIVIVLVNGDNMKKLALIATAVLIASSAYSITWPGSGKPLHRVSTTAQDGRIVYATPESPIIITGHNDTIQLLLPSNATTGYTWLLAGMDRNLLRVQSSEYVAPHTKLVGAGGFERWIFKINPKQDSAPTVTKIKMLYTRMPSANLAKPSDYSVFTVVIDPRNIEGSKQ